MRLSESLTWFASSDLEVTATVLNCNEGRNAAIMEACETLRGYAHLLALARSNHDTGMNLDEAVCDAVNQCIEEGVLANYLSKHRSEAIEMLFTIEDEERAMRVHWECVEREAREQGFEAGRIDGFKDGHKDGFAQGRRDGFAEGRQDGFKAEVEQGIEKGIEQGIEQGIETGLMQGLLTSLKSLMQTTDCNLTSAMEMLQVPESYRSTLKAQINSASETPIV